jgi:internalin A
MPTAAVGRPWRKYMRISVRGLIVAVLVLGGGLGWVVNRARVQRAAVAAIERAGGCVKYEWDFGDGQFISGGEAALPKWLLTNLGPNDFAHIAVADLARGATDEHLRPVAALKSLELFILRRSRITGSGLAPVAGLAELRNLQILKLNNTAVGDAGLEWLKGSTALHTLVLTGTNVTDAGVMKLQQALPELKVVR